MEMRSQGIRTKKPLQSGKKSGCFFVPNVQVHGQNTPNLYVEWTKQISQVLYYKSMQGTGSKLCLGLVSVGVFDLDLQKNTHSF
jgi:hypothetical protein